MIGMMLALSVATPTVQASAYVPSLNAAMAREARTPIAKSGHTQLARQDLAAKGQTLISKALVHRRSLQAGAAKELDAAVAEAKAALTQLESQDDLDEDNQLAMDEAVKRSSAAFEMLSNLMKKFEDTQSAIIKNEP